MTTTSYSLGQLIEILPPISALHSRETAIYKFLEAATDELISRSTLKDENNGKADLGAFGEVKLPYFKMGAIDSTHLFGLDELMIFSFYRANKNRYKKASDIGANIGLHSIMMSRCGWTVSCFEPDPIHVEKLQSNLSLNGINTVTVNQKAVSDKEGSLEFIRVKGNTTGSHLSGAKESPYGELDKFTVQVSAIADIMAQSDFIKMDVEGHEAHIIQSTTARQWANVDMMVEIGTPTNAQLVYEHLKKIGVNAFSQKKGWGLVATLGDVPKSYKEGSLFISAKAQMPWGN